MGQKIFLAIFIIVVMFPDLTPKNYFPGPTFLSLLAFIFLVLGILQWKKCDLKLTHLSPVAMSLLLFYGWGAIGYFYTGSLDTSYAPIVQYWGAIFLFLGLTLYVKNEIEFYPFIWIGLFCAAIHSLSVVFQLMPADWDLGKNGAITHFRNKNIFSSYILLFPPLAFFLRSYLSLRIPRLIADFLFVLIMVIFWLAGSKAGGGAMIIELLLISAYLIYQKDREGIKILLILILISTILYHLIISSSRKSSLHLDTGNTTTEITRRDIHSLGARIYYWQGAWGIVKDNWLTGTGPLTFSLVAPLYLAEIHDQRSIELRSAFLMNPSHAHSLYFQFASDLGAIGFGLVLILIYFIYTKSYYLFRDTYRPGHKLNFYTMVSITGYLLHGIFEYNWGYSEYIYTFTGLIFIVDFTIRKYSPELRKPDGLVLSCFPKILFGVVLIGGTVFFNYFFYMKAIKPNETFLGIKAPKWEKDIDRAKIMCPRCADPFLMLGKELLKNYYFTLNPLDLTRAKQQFNIAIHNNPLDLRMVPYLAETLALQGSFQEARENCSKLLKFQKYELNARVKMAVILLVESFVEKNPLSEPKQIVEAWKQAAKFVVSRHNKIADKFLMERNR